MSPRKNRRNENKQMLMLIDSNNLTIGTINMIGQDYGIIKCSPHNTEEETEYVINYFNNEYKFEEQKEK